MFVDVEKRLIKYDKNPDTFTVSSAPVIQAGGLTVTAGGLTVTAGGATVTGDVDVVGAIGTAQAAASAGSEFRMLHKQVEHTIVGGGITETLTGAIPAQAWVLGLQGKIKTTVTTTTLATFLLGVTGDTNRYGNFAALTQNTATTPADMAAEGAGAGRFYAAATDVLLTGNAGTFTAGVVVIDIYYFDLSPPYNFA